MKLKWRVDWPMRWKYEKVDFEPGGIDHSVYGGSYMTGKDIVKKIFGADAPLYQFYEWVRIKGGKEFSSSKGDVLTLNDVEEFSLQNLSKIPASAIQIRWDVKWERVLYSQEKALEISNSNVKQLSTFEPTNFLQIFCKPEKYSYQSEFRMVFRPYCPGFGYIDVKEEPKNLSLNLKDQISRFVSE